MTKMAEYTPWLTNIGEQLSIPSMNENGELGTFTRWAGM